MKRCSTEAWARCPHHQGCEPGAEYADGCPCDTYNQEIEAELSGDTMAQYLVQTIQWRSIKDPPKDYQYVIGWPEEETYPFPQARECYTTGRAPWAYFPGIGAQYRISHWAEMPVGPTPKGAKKK